MKKKSKSVKPAISTDIVPNKTPEAAPVLNTMTDFYQHYYKLLFDKLTKSEQDSLTLNLTKGAQIIRGEPHEFVNVRDFTRAVIETAEAEYEKSQAKKKAEAEKSSKK